MFAVWLNDFSSPLYISNRVGKNGKLFKMYKLRSMIIDANKKFDVFVGGQAFDNNRSKCDAIVIESSTPLEQIPRILSKRKK